MLDNRSRACVTALKRKAKPMKAQSVYHASMIAAIADAGFKVTSLEVATDPPSGVLMFSVYFDDGAGNGNCILSLPVGELLKVAAKVEALGS